VNCVAFERWLDERCPDDASTAAGAHAAACAACAHAWRAAVALETALAASPSPAPEGFTERVMARVRPGAARASLPAGLPAPVSPAMPWWIRAAGEPATVLALVVAAAVAWGGEGLTALAAAARAALAGMAAPAAVPGLSAGAALGIQAALAVAVALLAPGLAHAVTRLTSRLPMTRS
jgi:hypothetical protein